VTDTTFYHFLSVPEEKQGSNLMHLFMTGFHYVNPIIITSAHPRCGIAPPGQSSRCAMGDNRPKAR